MTGGKCQKIQEIIVYLKCKKTVHMNSCSIPNHTVDISAFVFLEKHWFLS